MHRANARTVSTDRSLAPSGEVIRGIALHGRQRRLAGQPYRSDDSGPLIARQFARFGNSGGKLSHDARSRGSRATVDIIGDGIEKGAED